MTESNPGETDVVARDPVDVVDEVIAYLRDEADFNRSWTDGRRGPPAGAGDGYVKRRLEIAEQRDLWVSSLASLASYSEQVAGALRDAKAEIDRLRSQAEGSATPDAVGLDAKAYAAVIYPITGMHHETLDAEQRAALADAIVAKLRERGLLAARPQPPSDDAVEWVAALLLGNVNAPENAIFRVARQIVERLGGTSPQPPQDALAASTTTASNPAAHCAAPGNPSYVVIQTPKSEPNLEASNVFHEKDALAAAVEAEREACAKICDRLRVSAAASAIRSRSTAPVTGGENGRD